MSEVGEKLKSWSSERGEFPPDFLPLIQGASDVDGSGNVWKNIMTPGDPIFGLPPKGTKVKVNYTEYKLNGKIKNLEKDLTFTLGSDEVFKGLDVGVGSMLRREVARLIIHPNYVEPVIGPNKPIIYVVDLREIFEEEEDLTSTQDSGIRRKVLRVGSASTTFPNLGAEVTISLEGKVDGKGFDSRENVNFRIGEGEALNICNGIEHALLKFTEHEKSQLTIRPSYGFGSLGTPDKFHIPIPPNSTLIYVIELKKYTRGKEAWALDGPEKMVCAREFKVRGTKYFEEGQVRVALGQYKRIVEFLKAEALLTGEEEEERKALITASYLNQSLCHLKLEEFLPARNTAEEALELDPKNTKALFRKGLANMELNDPEIAVEDFRKVLGLESDNKAAMAKLLVCRSRVKELTEGQRQLCLKMFDYGKKRGEPELDGNGKS